MKFIAVGLCTLATATALGCAKKPAQSFDHMTAFVNAEMLFSEGDLSCATWHLARNSMASNVVVSDVPQPNYRQLRFLWLKAFLAGAASQDARLANVDYTEVFRAIDQHCTDYVANAASEALREFKK